MANSLAVKDIKFSRTERRRHLVFHNFNTSTITNDGLTFFDLTNPANIQTYRSIKFKCISTGGSFRISEHDSNFFTELVNEDTATAGSTDSTSEFTKRLRH